MIGSYMCERTVAAAPPVPSGGVNTQAQAAEAPSPSERGCLSVFRCPTEAGESTLSHPPDAGHPAVVAHASHCHQ